MRPELYWIDGRWYGKLAIAARPRGNDWLQDEIEAWKASRINKVVSFLTPEEQGELGLEDEARLCESSGMAFQSFPIEDRSVPSDHDAAASLVQEIEEDLANGKNVALHCRQGLGRSAVIAGCLLVAAGLGADAAFQEIANARHCPVPETDQQRDWVIQFAREVTPASART
jgi:protein-tyrosine phosphatase